ncbi:MAG: hypothetical protein JNJ71_15200 [Rubrivivax sp.]|nr:hypothetical protein [Rubrivivax sp.]
MTTILDNTSDRSAACAIAATTSASAPSTGPVGPALPARWRRRTLLLIAAAAPLTGCVLESPYWGQKFASTTTPIPVQAWTTDKTRPLKLECSKAGHGGLYPFDGTESWTQVTTLMPSPDAAFDPSGDAIHGAGSKLSLPASCWYLDNAFDPPLYMTALRVTQGSANGGVQIYRVFNKLGLECMGRENGKAQSWFGWINKGCLQTYANSTTPVPYVRITATSLGVSASASLAAPLTQLAAAGDAAGTARSAPAAVLQLATLEKTFAAEAQDPRWAPSMEARLRGSYDSVSPLGTQVLDATCRSTMCRVDVQHADAAAQQRFMAAMLPARLFTQDGERGAMMPLDGRGLRFAYFMAREGSTLPRSTPTPTP